MSQRHYRIAKICDREKNSAQYNFISERIMLILCLNIRIFFIKSRENILVKMFPYTQTRLFAFHEFSTLSLFDRFRYLGKRAKLCGAVLKL